MIGRFLLKIILVGAAIIAASVILTGCSTLEKKPPIIETTDIPKPEGLNLDAFTLSLCNENLPALLSGEEADVIDFAKRFADRYRRCAASNELKFKALQKLFKLKDGVQDNGQ